MKKRFDTYNNITMPVVKEFEKKGLYERVDGEKSLEEVCGLVSDVFVKEGFDLK